jgi:hypothetical protein
MILKDEQKKVKPNYLTALVSFFIIFMPLGLISFIGLREINLYLSFNELIFFRYGFVLVATAGPAFVAMMIYVAYCFCKRAIKISEWFPKNPKPLFLKTPLFLKICFIIMLIGIPLDPIFSIGYHFVLKSKGYIVCDKKFTSTIGPGSIVRQYVIRPSLCLKNIGDD